VQSLYEEMPMAMSIRGLPDDVKERLVNDAKRRGVSLNAHVVRILSREAGKEDPAMTKAKSYVGRFTEEDMLRARQIEKDNALDWSMSYDDPS